MLPSAHKNPEMHHDAQSHDLDAKSHDQSHDEVEDDIDLPPHSVSGYGVPGEA